MAEEQSQPAMKGDLQDVQDQLAEATHDSETRLLKAFYSFAESN